MLAVDGDDPTGVLKCLVVKRKRPAAVFGHEVPQGDGFRGRLISGDDGGQFALSLGPAGMSGFRGRGGQRVGRLRRRRIAPPQASDFLVQLRQLSG